MRGGLRGGVGAAAALLVGVALVASRLAVAPDDAMSPSLLPGDVLFILPLTPKVGDVVAVVDPLDPSAWTLRRVETIGGAIAYNAGSYVREDEPQLLDMGRDDAGFTVIQEGRHLSRHLARRVDWRMDQVGVPDDSAWLGADNRDIALDSRWWGPVPLSYVQGVVVLRFGAPGNRWRGWYGRP